MSNTVPLAADVDNNSTTELPDWSGLDLDIPQSIETESSLSMSIPSNNEFLMKWLFKGIANFTPPFLLILPPKTLDLDTGYQQKMENRFSTREDVGISMQKKPVTKKPTTKKPTDEV